VNSLKPFFKNVQAHYDLSNDFFQLFLDPTMVYSCAYFEPENISLEEAQRAKIDLALGKIDLKPGHRLVDIGCGWGGVVKRAVEQYGVTAVGLTLSENQVALARSRIAHLGDKAEIRLQGWEEFDEPVDRIVSIGAFEHFREDRFAPFFTKCYNLMPTDGRMLLHTITRASPEQLTERGIELTHEDVLFNKFIIKKIFPGGQLRPPQVTKKYAEAAGFRVTRMHSLQPHYARTLDQWAKNLEAVKEKAIEITSQDVYDTYMHYLTGCASYFRSTHLDLIQFTLCK